MWFIARVSSPLVDKDRSTSLLLLVTVFRGGGRHSVLFMCRVAELSACPQFISDVQRITLAGAVWCYFAGCKQSFAFRHTLRLFLCFRCHDIFSVLEENCKFEKALFFMALFPTFFKYLFRWSKRLELYSHEIFKIDKWRYKFSLIYNYIHL